MNWYDRFDKYVAPLSDGCWRWTGHTYHNGYGQFKIKDRPYRAHRLAYERYIGPIPDGLFVLHKCDFARCVNPDHLYAGTQAQNMRDRDERGRHWVRKGSEHGMAKLTEESVRFIREWHAAGWPQVALAKACHVSTSTISLIVLRKGWANS